MYRVVLDGAVLDQIAALPTWVLPAYTDALGLLERVPDDGRAYNEDKPDGPMRELVFGSAGEGTITYLLLERQREAHVLLVQWAG